ncbi:MAG: autotransporter-associated beta strand repeat-containing protein, partial [Patescibacteria group bacterium]|nr:autotransporter-associated beta strand repeat-containing protein [Patescibacteria group bacterium]
MRCIFNQANWFAPPLRNLPVRVATALLAMLAMGAAAGAVDYYWDTNGTGAGASGGTTATGIWNASNEFWNTDSTGDAGGTISAWQSGGVAVFSAGGNATGTYTVTVSGTQQIGGVLFEEGAVTLSEGILQFTGGATFTHNGTAGDCQINSAVQGSGTLTLAGSGNWGRVNGVISESGGTLSVNLASGNWVFGGQHTYTGDTTINGYAVTTVSSTGSASSGNLASGPFGKGTLILQSGTIRSTSSGERTIGNAVTLAGNFTFGDGTTHGLVFSGPLTLTGNRTLTVNSANTTFNGVLGGGNFGFTKSGTSELVLGGNASNTFTGTVTVSDGVLTLNKSDGATAIAGDIVISGGRLSLGAANQIADTSNVTLNSGVWYTEHAETISSLTINSAPTVSGYSFHLINHLNVTGTLSIAAGETVVGSGTSSQAGTVSMTGGVLAVAANTGNSTLSIGSGGLSMSSATLRVGSDGGAHTALVNLSGDFTGSGTNLIGSMNNNGPRLLDLQGATRIFGVTDGTTTIEATVQNGGLTKTGAGTLVLSASNTYTGGTIVSEGILQLGANDVLADAGAVTVSGGTVDVNTRADTIGDFTLTSGSVTGTAGVLTASSYTVQSGTISAALGGTGTLTKTGTGTLTLSGSIANTYTGLTTVTDGVLNLSKTAGINAIAGDILINGGRLELGAANQIADTSNITVNSGVWYSSTTEIINNLTINSAPTVSGYGFHLINNLNVAGTLSISAGDVVVGSGGSAQANAVSMTGGVLAVASNTADSTFSISSGGLTMSGGELRLGYGGETFTALINMAGNFTGSGTSLISTPNSSGPRLLDLGGATRTFDITGGTTTVQPAIQNGGLTKTGEGTLVLSGSNTYTGGSTVSGGILRLGANNVLADAGAVTVSGGTLDINSRTDTVGSFTLTSGNVTGTTGVLT